MGMTRSYIPIGTMARFDPLVEVVKANFLPGSRREANVLIVENLLKPGTSQPRNSRARPSVRADT